VHRIQVTSSPPQCCFFLFDLFFFSSTGGFGGCATPSERTRRRDKRKTIYANAEHAFVIVAGHRQDASSREGVSGPCSGRWPPLKR
jgi:hypothetical protein